MLKFKAITKLSVFLFIAAFMSSAQASPRPGQFVNLSGAWKVSSSNVLDSSTVLGTLRIQHNMRTGLVTATSTSGGSRWTGYFDHKSRILRAEFKNGQISGKIYLQYTYRYPDEMNGKWFSTNTRDKGAYKAVRIEP